MDFDPEKTLTVPQGIKVSLGTHGVLVSIPNTVIKAAVAAIGLWFAQKAGMDLASLQTWLGGLVGAGALTSIGLSVHASNEATKAALDARS